MTWDVALLGLVTGIAFGFAILKFGACGYQRILDMLLLKDFSTLKFMMAAVMVGSIGVFLLDNVIWVAPLQIARLLVGGLIFGVGFALLGACPGTVMIGLGRGQKDSFFGVIGGLVGAGLFAEFYIPIKDSLYHIMDYGKVTMGSAFGLSEGVGVIILLVVFGGAIIVINKLTAPKGQQIEAENYSIK